MKVKPHKLMPASSHPLAKIMSQSRAIDGTFRQPVGCLTFSPCLASASSLRVLCFGSETKGRGEMHLVSSQVVGLEEEPPGPTESFLEAL